MLSEELTSDDWTKIARGEWKPKPYDLRMAGFDALKLLKRAESAEAELLSLREQLAELKALPPVGYVGNSDLYALSTGDLGCISPYNAFEGIPLFTAAKPAAGLGVEDITEFMRKAFWRGFESARGTENSNIPANWKDSKPNLLLALKAKMSGA
ncbi:hypothetical protein [Yersinia aldovae]|uniref:hypothetical protein n=1 Tax=Yersinia aldovae TaxID=29483 RepID=UPI0005ABF784|nr:hypothetical protein [Yersinia aldovae]AJJ64057.1 hypothetical protein AT01_1363 [Yersinia aldovae 670-83]